MRHAPLYLFVLLLSAHTISAQTTPSEKKTDSITRLMIRYLNEARIDSAYNLWSDEAKVNFSPEVWRNIYKTTIQAYLPFRELAFVGSEEGTNLYTAQSSVPLNVFSILDEKGFPTLPSNLDMKRDEQPYENYDLVHLFSYLKTATPATAPGKVFAYSNLGFGLLGVLLERVYGMNYAALLSKYITGPLKLNHTGITVDAAAAQGYDGALNPVDVWDFNSLKSAGAIKSNTADLLKYATLQLEQGSDLLHKAIALAHQPTFDDGNTKIGLAWLRYQHKDELIFHNGGTGGCRSFLMADTAANTAVVLLVNSVNFAALSVYRLSVI